MTTKTSRRATVVAMPVQSPLAGSDSQPTNLQTVPVQPASAAPTSPAPNQDATPIERPARGTKSTERHVPSDPHGTDALGSNVPDPVAEVRPMPKQTALLDPALALAADVLDDIERVRKANANRLRQLTRTGADKDGEERGFGLDPDHPDVMRLGLMLLALERIEHDAVLSLQGKLRKHPLAPWVQAQRGVGQKQAARLLAAIGDPYINSAKGQPRTVSALWAYCGLHVLPAGHCEPDTQVVRAGGDQHRDTDQQRRGAHAGAVGVAAKRRKGERANWSTNAKTRAYLVAESCMKQRSPDCRDGHTTNDSHAAAAVPAPNPQVGDGQSTPDTQARYAVPACACSPYRVVYDRRRAHTAVTHPEWTDGHSLNDALRVTSKEILKDLWRAARDWHLVQGGAA